ncbi:MAG: AbrB/MazE/SpoVT family DNA-binding domain-containing protein [Candidatus Diapherotrites archaeon]
MQGTDMHAVAIVKKWGNSMGVVIPKEATRKLKLKPGQEVSLEIRPKKYIDGFGMFKGAGTFERDHDDHEF